MIQVLLGEMAAALAGEKGTYQGDEDMESLARAKNKTMRYGERSRVHAAGGAVLPISPSPHHRWPAGTGGLPQIQDPYARSLRGAGEGTGMEETRHLKITPVWASSPTAF